MMLSLRIFRRAFSTKHTASALYHSREWLAELNSESLPRRLFAVSFARSSGPGGQNVNKVSTKATIKLTSEQWQNADWIPEPVREQVASEGFPYTTKSGSLVVQSDRTRSRSDNVQDCYDKLVNEIREFTYIEGDPDPEKIKRWENIRRAASNERLKEKKMIKDKKQGRRLSRNEM